MAVLKADSYRVLGCYSEHPRFKKNKKKKHTHMCAQGHMFTHEHSILEAHRQHRCVYCSLDVPVCHPVHAFRFLAPIDDEDQTAFRQRRLPLAYQVPTETVGASRFVPIIGYMMLTKGNFDRIFKSVYQTGMARGECGDAWCFLYTTFGRVYLVTTRAALADARKARPDTEEIVSVDRLLEVIGFDYTAVLRGSQPSTRLAWAYESPFLSCMGFFSSTDGSMYALPDGTCPGFGESITADDAIDYLGHDAACPSRTQLMRFGRERSSARSLNDTAILLGSTFPPYFMRFRLEWERQHGWTSGHLLAFLYMAISFGQHIPLFRYARQICRSYETLERVGLVRSPIQLLPNFTEPWHTPDEYLRCFDLIEAFEPNAVYNPAFRRAKRELTDQPFGKGG